jgi:hypothetical protein
VALAVLAHVEAVKLHAQHLRELLGELGLADARGPREEEAADGLLARRAARARELDGRAERLDGGVLPVDDGLELGARGGRAARAPSARDGLLGDLRDLRHDGLHVGEGDALQAGALGLGAHAVLRAGLVDDVDGLVGQEAVVDVLRRELDGGREGLGVYFTSWCASY